MNGIICTHCREKDVPIKAVELPYEFGRDPHVEARSVWCCMRCDSVMLWPRFQKATR